MQTMTDQDMLRAAERMNTITITIINPWTGAQGTRDVSDATQQQIEHYAAHMDDEENYLCECSAGTPAEWVAHMAAVLVVIASSPIAATSSAIPLGSLRNSPQRIVSASFSKLCPMSSKKLSFIESTAGLAMLKNSLGWYGALAGVAIGTSIVPRCLMKTPPAQHLSCRRNFLSSRNHIAPLLPPKESIS
jgi:hypothetical protein